MPLTLTAGVDQARVAQQYAYDLLIEAPTLGLRLSWRYEDANGWEHRLLSVDPIETGIPSGGGVGYVSQLSFRYAQDGLGQSLLLLEDLHPNMHVVPITLKLLFDGEAYANAVALFTGRIDTWEVVDGEAFITAVDDRLTRNIDLPKQLISRSTHTHAPDQSIGQAIPIVYGSGATLAPIPLLLVDATNWVYQVSHHANAQMIAFYATWPAGTDRLKTIQATEDQAAVLGTNQLRLVQLLTEVKFGLNVAPPQIFAQVTVTGATNVLDTDPETVATIATTAADGIGRLVIDFPLEDPIGINTIDLQLLAHHRNLASAPTVSGSFTLDTIRRDGTTAVAGLWTSLERRIASRALTEPFRIPGVSLQDEHILRMTIEALNEGGPGGVEETYLVGSIIIEGYYQVAGPFEAIYLPDITYLIGDVFADDVFEDEVFAGAIENTFQGRADDAAGAITGTPHGVFARPSDVIASIHRDELGLTIDPETFSAAQTARQTWLFAGGIGYGWYRSRTAALDLLHSLCLQGAYYLYPKGDGTDVLKAIDPLNTATFAIGPAGSADDFLLYSPVDPTTPATEWRRTLRYRGGRSDTIRNTYELRYAYHVARAAFAKLATASWLGTTGSPPDIDAQLVELLQASHDMFGDKDTYSLDCDFIYDEETAHKLLNILVQYWVFPRHEVEFESTMAPLPLLLGETISMDTVGMPASMRGQVFEVDRIRYDFDQGRMFLHGTQRRLFRIDYFAIKDQTDVVWYWRILGNGEQIEYDTTLPAMLHAVAVDISDVIIPYWLEIADETATARYVYPNEFGQPVVDGSPPAIGPGRLASPTWTDLRSNRYEISTNSFNQATITRVNI